MSNKSGALSSRYYSAEVFVWLLGIVLLAAHFVGLVPGQVIPGLGISIGEEQGFVRIVALLQLATTLYMLLEWRSFRSEVDTADGSGFRCLGTVLFSIICLWVLYPDIFKGTLYADVSRSWYVVFLVIGTVLGGCIGAILDTTLVIRSSEDAERLRLPILPAVTKAQLTIYLPLTLLALIAYYFAVEYCPWPVRLPAACILMLAVGFNLWVSFSLFFLATDDEGVRIPYKKRVAIFRKVFDTHDYQCHLLDRGAQRLNELGLTPEDGVLAPDAQQVIRDSVAAMKNDSQQRFHVENLEDVSMQPAPRDGNEANGDFSNLGLEVLNKDGEKGDILVLFVPESTPADSEEVSISCSSVERYANEYITEQGEGAELDWRAVGSHGMNEAVLEALKLRCGPLLLRYAEAGDEEGIKAEIEQKANINEQGEAGWTALLYGVAQGYPCIVRLLLESGANPDLSNVLGISPLMYGVHYDDEDSVRQLLDYGADVNLQDTSGGTALMVASQMGREAIALLLLEAGADIRVKNFKQMSALDYAQDNGHGKLARRLRMAMKS